MLRAVVELRFFTISVAKRNLRSAANRDRTLPRFIKGKVITLDRNVADQLGPVDTYDELNRSLKRMFTDPDSVQTEMDLDKENDKMSSMFSVPGKAEHMSIEALKQHQRVVKKKIVERMYFKPPKETNLLTWAAKKQIKYLHQLDPEEWSPERLSECFPISVPGAKRLLKHKSKRCSPEEIAAHDAEVAERWKILQSEEDLSSISPVTVKLWKEGKLIKDFYSGNVNLPQPPECETGIKLKPKKIGEHLAIVEKYLDLKKETDDKKLKEVGSKVPAISPTKNVPEIGKNIAEIQESVLPHLEHVPVSKSEAEDQLATSFLATSETDKDEPDVLLSQFKQNLTEEFSSKKEKTPVDATYLKWLQETEKKDDCDTITEEVNISGISGVSAIQKFNIDNTIELTKEKGIAYLYDEKLGYQYPVGKNIVKYRVRIPHNVYKKGAIYRIGRSVYDDTGEFLYRLPFELQN